MRQAEEWKTHFQSAAFVLTRRHDGEMLLVVSSILKAEDVAKLNTAENKKTNTLTVQADLELFCPISQFGECFYCTKYEIQLLLACRS